MTRNAAMIGGKLINGEAAMSAAANKELMQEIFAAAGDPDPAVRDRALFVASLADDAKWVVTGQYSWSRNVYRQGSDPGRTARSCPFAAGRAGAHGRASLHRRRRPRRGRGQG
jgi:hypothetical protein